MPPYKPIRPALIAARIYALVILTGPLFLFLINYLYELQDRSMSLLQPDIQPDYVDLYTILLLSGAILALVPFLITWALLASWNKKRLPAYMMAERLLLLDLLFLVFGSVSFMLIVPSLNPFGQAMLLCGPYFLAGILGILVVLGWPYRR